MRQQTCTTVTLRQRPIRNGRISLYLDYYPAVRNPKTMKLSRREYLGFYIYATPKNAIELDYNNEILAKAELIRCRRQEAVINEEFGFMDRHKMRADFMAYFKEVCRKKDHKWHIVYLHFEKFVNGKCMFGEITVDRLSGNFWLVSFKISYLCLPLFHETRTTPSCHPSGCAYRQL